MTADQFVQQFKNCDLDPNKFRHRDHIRLAWLYLEKHSLLKACSEFKSDLQRFVSHFGFAEKYHETLTLAWLLLVYEGRASLGAGHTWADFEREKPEFFHKSKELLLKYYDEEDLSSSSARQSFVLP